jgi:hypothetical protein
VGQGEGVPEGDEAPAASYTADQSGDGQIVLSELLRIIQFFNSDARAAILALCAVPAETLLCP